jgi:hypothetical protein
LLWNGAADRWGLLTVVTIGCHGLVWTGTFDEAGLAAAADGTALGWLRPPLSSSAKVGVGTKKTTGPHDHSRACGCHVIDMPSISTKVRRRQGMVAEWTFAPVKRPSRAEIGKFGRVIIIVSVLVSFALVQQRSSRSSGSTRHLGS